MTWTYYKRRYEYMFQHRRPRLVIAFNIASLLFIGVYSPLHIGVLESRGHARWYLENSTLFTSEFILFVTLALRIWHSFYDFQVTRSLSTVLWKAILNEEYRTKKQPLLLRYKPFLGMSLSQL